MTLLKRDLDFSHLFQLTLDWNRIGAGGVYDMSVERQELQHKCLVEEGITELNCAIEHQDEVEFLDAIADTLFVAVYCVRMQYREFNDNGIVSVLNRPSDYYLQPEALAQTIQTFIRFKAYSELVNLIVQNSVYLRCDFKKAYEEVVHSNFSKYPMIEDVILADELNWFNTESKYSNVVAQEVDGHYVFRCDGGNGKITKPRCFREPNLKQFIWS